MRITAQKVRQIVAGTDAEGKAVAFSHAPSPDVHTDPARPGFFATRLWLTDATPAPTKGVHETLQHPHALEPPSNGSVFRFYEFPPERDTLARLGESAARDYFHAMGSPQACAYGAGPHLYMQKTCTLDFCYVLAGEIVLVLEAGEATLKTGDTTVLRGAAHAWSNRSNTPAIVAVSSHDAAKPTPLPGAAPPLTKPPQGPTKFIRRVVTGHDEKGRSCIVYDGSAPNMKHRPGTQGTVYGELWTEDRIPADIAGNRDDGWVDRPVEHAPPALGARFRVPMPGKTGVTAAHDEEGLTAAFASMNKSGMSERRGHSAHHWHMHRSRTVDYAISVQGERFLVLDDAKFHMATGDVVIQLANFHA